MVTKCRILRFKYCLQPLLMTHQKRLQFDGSFAYNLYQWYIHKGIQ